MKQPNEEEYFERTPINTWVEIHGEELFCSYSEVNSAPFAMKEE